MMIHCIPMSGLIENPKLYSSVQVSLIDEASGFVQEALYDEAACYAQDIAQAMEDLRTEKYPTNDLMRYFVLPDKRMEAAIKEKVLSAHPTVQTKGPILYAVLELDMVKDLTVDEFRSFTNQIAHQYEDGWGEQLEFHDIKAKNSDVICIRLYYDGVKFFTGNAFEQHIKRAKIRQSLKHTPER